MKDMREVIDRLSELDAEARAKAFDRLLAVATALQLGHGPEVDRLLELEPESEAWLDQLAKLEKLSQDRGNALPCDEQMC